MEQIFIIFGIFVAGFILGWEGRERAAKKVVSRMLDQMEEELDKEKKEGIHIKIERDGDFFFVYDQESKAFMGQASNRIDLEKVLAEKFPGKRFFATSDNLKEVGFK
jgi:hypothetical protein